MPRHVGSDSSFDEFRVGLFATLPLGAFPRNTMMMWTAAMVVCRALGLSGVFYPRCCETDGAG